MPSKLIRFASGKGLLAGEVVFPEVRGPHPGILLIGGTMSDTRDGDPAASLAGAHPTHGMLRVIAERLAKVGVASLRWDKRGVGRSTGGDRSEQADVWTDVDDAHQALEMLCSLRAIDPKRVVVFGESAGAYFACLLAKLTPVPAGYVLQGALYDPIPEMMEFNYRRVRDYCARGHSEEEWVRRVAPQAFLLGLHWDSLMEAAQEGDDVYEGGEGPTYLRMNLRRFKQELNFPPSEQFRFIKGPALVIQGDKDMNVHPDNCYKVARALREAGNNGTTLSVIPNTDHSMQLAADDEETRLRERISMASFARPYSEVYLEALSTWLSHNLLDS